MAAVRTFNVAAPCNPHFPEHMFTLHCPSWYKRNGDFNSLWQVLDLTHDKQKGRGLSPQLAMHQMRQRCTCAAMACMFGTVGRTR